MLDKLIKLLSYKQKKNLIILLCLWLILYFLEVVGLGTIPLLLSIILENQGFANIKFLTNIMEKLSIYVPIENKVLLISCLVILFFIFKNIYYIFLSIYEAKVIKELDVEVRDQVFRNRLNLPYVDLLNISNSQIVRSITLDASVACSYIISIVTLIGQSFLFIFILCLLLIIDYKVIILILPFFGSIFYLFYFLTSKKLIRLGKEKQALGGKIIKNINNTFENFKEVKIYNKISFIAGMFKNDLSSNHDKVKKILILKKIPRAVYELLGIFLIFFIVFYLTYNSYSKEDIIIILSLITIAIIRILPSMNLITQSLSNIRSSQHSFNSINDIIKKNIENNEDKIINLNNKIIFDKKIEFKNVSFKYKNSKYKLEKLNFTIEKNSKIGIYGASGNGKSTIINLFTGLLKPNSGTITADGQNINNNILSWQTKIGYVTQENYLMDDTILNNILFSGNTVEYSQERLDYSIKKTNIDEFINNLEDGLNTEVGDKGIKLSGGQKQRIAIARALYASSEILIFDEATNSLDRDTQKEMLDNIYSIMDKTIIIISHDLKTLESCDRIMHVQNKNILELDRAFIKNIN